MYIFFLAAFLFVVSCSNDSLYNGGSQSLYVEAKISPSVVEVGDSVLFTASIFPDLSSAAFFSWKIDSNIVARRLEFKRDYPMGKYNVSFYATDYFGDTALVELPLVVSKAPVLKNLSWKVFQGSPTFRWECENPDTTSSIHYSFKLKVKDILLDTVLVADSLQWGRELPKDSFEISLEAINDYNLKSRIDSVWRAK